MKCYFREVAWKIMVSVGLHFNVNCSKRQYILSGGAEYSVPGDNICQYLSELSCRLFSVGAMARKLEKKLVQVIHEEDDEMMET